MTRTRVVHYNHTGVLAGAERVLLNAMATMRVGSLDSIVLSPPGPLQQEAQRLGVACRECHSLEARFTSNPAALMRYLQSFAVSVRDLRSQLGALSPEVVHANSVRAGLVATIATVGTGVPIVWHVHDTLPRHPLSVMIRAIAASSRRTSQLAVSESTARAFCGHVWHRRLSEKTEVLYNAVDRAQRVTTETERAAVRRELGAEGRLLVGCVGQICDRKNQLGMVEIFRDVLRYEPTALLVIVGAALFEQNLAYERQLKNKIEELGLSSNVLLLGARSDVPLLLETLDLLVLPSKSEPFAMILLEAMASGLATVAFSVDGVPELLCDRRSAWLVPAGDNLQMTRTIVWAARHPEQRHRIGEAARAELTKWLSPREYASRLAELLRKRRGVTADTELIELGQEEEAARLGDAA